MQYSIEDLEWLHQYYDYRKKLLYLPLKFISKQKSLFLKELKLHVTRESIDYVLLLLSENIYTERVEAILSVIISLQNQQVDSTYYGGWPKYLENTYFRSKGNYYKFDHNWTEFISFNLCRILLNDTYQNKIKSDLIKAITTSIASSSVAIQRRNVIHFYTNIYVLGMAVSLLAGKLLNNQTLYQYGLTRLNIIYLYAIKYNCFAEYNSPIYSIITLKTLFYLRVIFKDKFYNEGITLKKIDELYDIAWQEIGNYFHSVTKQWSGPHSRAYSVLLDSSIEKFLKQTFFNLDNDRTLYFKKEKLDVLQVPAKFKHLFTSLDQYRMITRYVPSEIGTQILRTYLTQEYTIATVSYSDFWEQRHVLLAYWRKLNNTTYLRLRCLHNGKDFSVAQFFSVQNQANIIGIVNFATNVNKENIYLRKNKMHKYGFPTYDLRLRFEFGKSSNDNDIDFNIIHKSNFLLILYIDSLYFKIFFPYINFDDIKPKWSILSTGKIVNVDLVLYFGGMKIINLSKLKYAVASFNLQMSDIINDITDQSINVNVDNISNQITLTTKDLNCSVSSKPQSIQTLRESFVGTNYQNLDS